MFQFIENVCPGSKFCISEKHSMTIYFWQIYFIYDEFILFNEYEEFILFIVSIISCSLIQFSYFKAVVEPTSCLIKYTIIKIGRLVIIFAESTIKLNFSGVIV